MKKFILITLTVFGLAQAVRPPEFYDQARTRLDAAQTPEDKLAIIAEVFGPNDATIMEDWRPPVQNIFGSYIPEEPIETPTRAAMRRTSLTPIEISKLRADLLGEINRRNRPKEADLPQCPICMDPVEQDDADYTDRYFQCNAHGKAHAHYPLHRFCLQQIANQDILELEDYQRDLAIYEQRLRDWEAGIGPEPRYDEVPIKPIGTPKCPICRANKKLDPAPRVHDDEEDDVGGPAYPAAPQHHVPAAEDLMAINNDVLAIIAQNPLGGMPAVNPAPLEQDEGDLLADEGEEPFEELFDEQVANAILTEDEVRLRALINEQNADLALSIAINLNNLTAINIALDNGANITNDSLANAQADIIPLLIEAKSREEQAVNRIQNILNNMLQNVPAHRHIDLITDAIRRICQ